MAGTIDRLINLCKKQKLIYRKDCTFSYLHEHLFVWSKTSITSPASTNQ